MQKIIIKSEKLKGIKKGAFEGISDSCIVEVPEEKYDEYKKMLLKGGLSTDVKVITIEEAQKESAGRKVSWTFDAQTDTLEFTGNTAIDVTEAEAETEAVIETETSDNTSASSDAKTGYGWQAYAEKTKKVIINEGITGIGESAFECFTALKNVDIPDTVKQIDDCAFEGCSALTHVNIAENSRLIKIGRYAFKDCTSLKSITLPENLKSICRFAFADCTKLKEIKVPDAVTLIDTGAFMDCKSLTLVELPKNLDKLRDRAFAGCKKLTEITIPEKVTSVTMSAFTGTAINEITIPKNVTVICKGISIADDDTNLSENTELKKITVESKKLTSVAKGAFAGLSEKCEVSVPEKKLKKYQKMFNESGVENKLTTSKTAK